VLWLKEEVLKGKPLTKLLELKTFLGGANYNGDIKLIGPFSSDMLRDMVKETRSDSSCLAPERKGHALKNVKFYAYGASAPDDQLLKDLTDRCQTVQRYFEQLGIDLQRTIATDDTLARGIVTELQQRRVSRDPAREDDVALISEWDTFYGQTFPQTVARQFACPDASSDCPWIHKFTYLRGLDGLLPSVERRRIGNKTKQRHKETNRLARQIFSRSRPIQRLWSGRLDRANSIIFDG
jgi:hypothetical protein